MSTKQIVTLSPRSFYGNFQTTRWGGEEEGGGEGGGIVEIFYGEGGMNGIEGHTLFINIYRKFRNKK